jgi:hypothetical protein
MVEIGRVRVNTGNAPIEQKRRPRPFYTFSRLSGRPPDPAISAQPSRVARAFAKRFGTPHQAPQIVSTDAIAAELGEWARGFARDQQLSGARARRELGRQPKHLDPEGEIARLP